MMVIVNRFKKEIALQISWPVEKIDIKRERLRPRHKGDRDCVDYNLMIGSAMAKANEIFKYYRLTDQAITINKFMKDYRSELSKNDFLDFYKKKAELRYRTKEIVHDTYSVHLRTLRKLLRFANVLPFKELHENWAKEFDAWLKVDINSRKGDSTNTRWQHHKNVKAYLKMARQHHIHFTNPYDFFKTKMGSGSWSAVFEDDFRTLYEYYRSPGIKANHVRPLRKFLFAVNTGLRISDLNRVEEKWVIDGILVFVPHKNRRFGKVQKIPLSKMARELLEDARVDKGDNALLFKDYADQKSNELLKKIAEKLGIKVNLHHHVARHSFISLYYKKTKDIVSAQEFAGHHSVKITEKYTHTDPVEIKERMKPMDDII